LVHDVWGLAEHQRDLARRLAAQGFTVLAVDLYRREFKGQKPQIANAGAWIQDLSDPLVQSDLEAAATYLRRVCAAPRVGLVGFCMGGMYTVLAACTSEHFDAAVPFYGILSHQHGMLYREEGLDPARKPIEPVGVGEELRCPILAFFGGEDALVPLEDVHELEAGFRRSSKAAEVVVMEGAGHAFMNDARPEVYHPEAARVAWRRSCEFLKRELSES